jgi:uncharacterized repeat protein (TIGR03803 family)
MPEAFMQVTSSVCRLQQTIKTQTDLPCLSSGTPASAPVPSIPFSRHRACFCPYLGEESRTCSAGVTSPFHSLTSDRGCNGLFPTSGFKHFIDLAIRVILEWLSWLWGLWSLMKLRTLGIVRALQLLLGLAVLETLVAHAQKFTVLYNFAGPPDGGVPYASLVDASGALYGTTYVGGTGACTIEYEPVGCGTIFKVTGKKETVLYSFKGEPDGESPIGGLVKDDSGKFYGTTVAGGAFDSGTIFRMTGKKETVLHSFKGAPDGVGPSGTLLRDAAGNFYGTTSTGGANSVGGTVFKMDTNGNETVLYSFCSEVNCADGEYPQGALVMDASGNLYGTTTSGGNTGAGTVFKLDTSGNETVLYSFCPVLGSCTDGANPEGGLVVDASGNLYGTTYDGAYYGNVFELDTTGNETVLHAFCSEPGCADGAGPRAGLIMDAKGNLYGTTFEGATGGTVFELDASGAFSVLHSFTNGGPEEPIGGLVMDAKGKLYGTASQGGPGNCNPLEFSGCGAVFKIKP